MPSQRDTEHLEQSIKGHRPIKVFFSAEESREPLQGAIESPALPINALAQARIGINIPDKTCLR